MTSSFLSNVPKLKGRENYDDWAFAVQNLLVLEDTDKYLKQEAEATDAAQTVADARARAKLILTIDTSLFVHIKETKTTKELWSKLKLLFDDSGFSRRITLLRHLISIRLETCENMTSYVTQIVETSQRLSGTGFIINDDWVGSLLLAGLPDKFMPMIMAIEHSGIQITADSIKTKLLDMENGGCVEVNGNDNSAFIARSWQKKKLGKVGNNNKYGGPTPNVYAPTSISPFAMMFGCFCSGPISDAIGRRTGQILLTLPFILGWVVIGLARNNITMLVGRFITGICTGAIRPLTMVYIGEISDPKYRAMALYCPALAAFVGCLISHTVGYYVPWRISSFLFMIPNITCLAILLLLKESPLWLISKGQTDNGVESFKWFRGTGEHAERELKLVLDNQDKETMSNIKQITSIVFTKPFLKSVISMFFVFVAVQLCGINTITFYAQDIFKNTFGGEADVFMLMILTDVIRVIFTGIMCLLATVLPRKKTFLISCFGTTVVLVGLSTFLYIKPAGLLWLAITCLVAYIAVASVLTSISWSFVAEIFPSKVRGLGSGLSSLMSFSLLFVSVKVTPSIMTNFGEAALYGSFAAVTTISGLFLCCFLPETNGKSLQEIENKLYRKKEKAVMPQNSLQMSNIT